MDQDNNKTTVDVADSSGKIERRQIVLGIQTGINVVGALVYPTSLRANGSGWELGIGRIGSIVGPLVGGLLLGLPIEQIYLWSAVPFLVAAVICFAIYRLNAARLVAHPELVQAQ